MNICGGLKLWLHTASHAYLRFYLHSDLGKTLEIGQVVRALDSFPLFLLLDTALVTPQLLSLLDNLHPTTRLKHNNDAHADDEGEYHPRVEEDKRERNNQGAYTGTVDSFLATTEPFPAVRVVAREDGEPGHKQMSKQVGLV